MKRRTSDDLLILFDGIELFWPLGVFLTLVSALLTAFAVRFVAGLDLGVTLFAHIWFLKWMPWLLPVVLLVITLCLGSKTFRAWRTE